MSDFVKVPVKVPEEWIKVLTEDISDCVPLSREEWDRGFEACLRRHWPLISTIIAEDSEKTDA